MKVNNYKVRKAMVEEINTLLPYNTEISIGMTLITNKYFIKFWVFDYQLGVRDCVLTITYKTTSQLYIALEAILKFYTTATRYVK